MIKIASWNVNGIRACCKNGFINWFQASKFDIVALQEVRAEPDQIPTDLLSIADYHYSWFAAQKKGYSGVGILAKRAPLKVIQGINTAEFDSEGRVLTAEFEGLYMVSAYFPNSQGTGLRIDYKVRFCKAIHKWVQSLRDSGKPVVLSGDFNIAHKAIDLARPEENEETAGYLPQEREWMTDFVDAGWVDSFRYKHPDAVDRYSWWSMRTRARPRNIGWRIDYNTVHSKDQSKIAAADILSDVMGSDHCPVSLDLDVNI